MSAARNAVKLVVTETMAASVPAVVGTAKIWVWDANPSVEARRVNESPASQLNRRYAKLSVTLV